MRPVVMALVDDLLFLSRIREAARGLGLVVEAARTADALLAGAARGARLAVVDADGDRLPWREALVRLRAEPSCADLVVVAYVSHTNAERAADARAAGANRVLARSAFVQQLPALLADAADSSRRLESSQPDSSRRLESSQPDSSREEKQS